MKRSEKLFLAINEIDGDIVEEAKPEEEKPIRMKPEPRSPMKGIIALAACVAVLAVGIFAIVKFKLGREMDPIQSDSSEYSSENSESSNSSESNGRYTAEDLKLQEILFDVVPKVYEIDRMFEDMGMWEGGQPFEFPGTDGFGSYYRQRGNCYAIPDGKRTFDGSFAVPQTYDEMEALLSEYLSSRSAEYYMSYVYKCSYTRESDGTLNIVPYDKLAINPPIFMEIDGRLYYVPQNNIRKPELGHSYCSTARVSRKTDTSIEYTTAFYKHDPDYPSCGAVVYENGKWKMHYFRGDDYYTMIPTEYSEEDIELQNTLKDIVAGYEIALWFNGKVDNNEDCYFVFPEIPYVSINDDILYTALPQKETASWSGLEYPESLDELEELLLKYFTQETVDTYMNRGCTGSMTANPDGKYSVVADSVTTTITPNFIEINGRLYFRGIGDNLYGYTNFPMWSTTHITSKTKDSINFTFFRYGTSVCSNMDGQIKFERGGWKWNIFYNGYSENRIPTEFTEEDKELQEILKDPIAGVREVNKMFTEMQIHNDVAYYGLYGEEYYLIPDGQQSPTGMFTVPRSCEEMEQLLLSYFSEQAAAYYMEFVTRGSITQNADGIFKIEFPQSGGDQYYFNWIFVEADGKMYIHSYPGFTATLYSNIDIETAKVTRRTDNSIEFTYWGSGNNYDYYYDDRPYGTGYYSEKKGIIVLEDGAWKLHRFYESDLSQTPVE